MMIISWFNAAEAKQFGRTLAQALIERTPVESAMSNGALSKKHEAMMNKLAQLVAQFKQEHQLNIFKKATLGNTFKWTLIEKGYDRGYVDQLTNWLMLKL